MAWILGEWGFHKYDFIVTPGVLCPRPDTETLVEAALQLIPKKTPRTNHGSLQTSVVGVAVSD